MRRSRMSLVVPTTSGNAEGVGEEATKALFCLCDYVLLGGNIPMTNQPSLFWSILTLNHQNEASDHTHHRILTPKLIPPMTLTLLVGQQHPTRIVIGTRLDNEIKGEASKEDDRKLTVESCLFPSIKTHKKMMLSHMMTGIAKWMLSYNEDIPNGRLRWPFWMPWRVGQRGQHR